MIYSSMTYIIFTLLHNLLDFRQVNLFKRAKHWDSFFTHCITLPNLRIIDYVIGHCGSTHNSTAFQDSHTVLKKQRLIGPGEWIWADSAYPIEAWCITPFKKPAANAVTSGQSRIVRCYSLR